LLRALEERPRPGATVLDIGGGVGVIHHELLRHGFAGATHVDRSQAYIDVASAEAATLGHQGRVQFVHGDFRAVADALEPADVVTLDRVVCCDPDFRSLLPLAAERARQALALSYPRDRGYVRWFVALSNAWRRAWGSDFRVYVHIVWSIEVWERGPDTGPVAKERA